MSRSDPPLVDLRGFGWRHAGRSAWALRDIDLRIDRGERVLLLGPSGAGKSTLLAALGGLLANDSGEQAGTITVAGDDPRHRQASGSLFQDPQSQIVMARCGDDVAFGLENRGTPTAVLWDTVDAALAAVGFPRSREHRTDVLSGGELQRLAIAGVLATRPDLLLLDEPTSNLDPTGATLARKAIAAAQAAIGAAMVLTEHRVADTLGLVDRVVVLGSDGTVLADGEPEAVFATYAADLAAAGVWVPNQASPHRRRGPQHSTSTDTSADTNNTTNTTNTTNTSNGGNDLLMAAEAIGYTHPGAPRPSLVDINVEVRAARAIAITGPNGAGKSTLALILAGLLAPTTGTLRATNAFAGRHANRPPHRWRAATLARRIGSVFQNPEHQFLTGRVRHELALGPERVGCSKAEITKITDDLLDRLHLSHLADANPFTLSGGEQRRLSVATALATEPAILVLDEPTFGQDRRTWIELVDMLNAVRSDGRAIVAVTHDPDLVDALADEVVILKGGRTIP